MIAQWHLILLIIILTVLIGLAIWTLAQRKPQVHLPSIQNKQSLTVLGHTLFYETIGKGPSLFLIHGIGASSFVWRKITPILSKNFNVISIDLLGFGRSDKPLNFSYNLDDQCEIILDFMHSLKMNECFLVGSSMGGAIALRLTQLRPDMFKKTIVISPAADPKISIFNMSKLHFLSSIVSPIISDRFIEKIMRLVVSDPSLITPETISSYAAPYKDKNAMTAFAKSFSLLRDSRIQSGLIEIKNPILMLWGKKDKIISVKYADKIQKKIPFCKIEIHPTAGHHVQEDDPIWTSHKILDFLTSKNSTLI